MKLKKLAHPASFDPGLQAVLLGQKYGGQIALGFAHEDLFTKYISVEGGRKVPLISIDSPVFSFRIGSTQANPGEVVLRGIDPSHYKGEIRYIPVRRRGYWEIELSSISLGGETLELGNTGVVIDSSASLIALPTDVANLINNLIGAKKWWSGQYAVDCNTVAALPDVTFHFGGKPYTLTGSEYIVKFQGACLSAFAGSDQEGPRGSIWVLGQVFMRKYFTVYDFNRNAIGFALSA